MLLRIQLILSVFAQWFGRAKSWVRHQWKQQSRNDNNYAYYSVLWIQLTSFCIMCRSQTTQAGEYGSPNTSLNEIFKLNCIMYDFLAAGLKVAHNNHIIHRDLKPKNILLCFSGPRYPSPNSIILKIGNGNGWLFRTQLHLSYCIIVKSEDLWGTISL